MIRNTAILICVAAIVSILFKMQGTLSASYSLEFSVIAIIAPFSTISNGFRFKMTTLFGIVLMTGSVIEINYPSFTEMTYKIILLWVVYIFGYLISDITTDNNTVI